MTIHEEPADRPPVQEMANRAATAGAGLAAAAKAVALADHKRMLDEANRRTREGHVAMMLAAGFDPDSLKTDEDDEMGGDVTVTGDIHITTTPPAPQSPSAQQTAPSDAEPRKPSKAAAAALPLAAAALGTGLGAAGLAAVKMMKPTTPTPAVQPATHPRFTDTDTQYELRLSTGEPNSS